MNINEFWSIIEKVKESDEPEIDVEEILKQLEPEELTSYQKYFDTLHEKSYRWDLWGAAYIMEGGCSDDGFMDFRYGLISKGKEVYEKALSNPDSLADLGSNQEISNESFCYVALEIYEQKTGKEMQRKSLNNPKTQLERIGTLTMKKKIESGYRDCQRCMISEKLVLLIVEFHDLASPG